MEFFSIARLETYVTCVSGHGDAIQMAEDNFLGPTYLENDVLQVLSS